MNENGVTGPDLSVVEDAAQALLSGTRVSAAVASDSLPDRPGLYAVFADDDAQRVLGLPATSPGWPVYVGKAEDSLLRRDGRTHFALGRTGQSTLRRSIAALLRDDLGLTGRPRNLAKPGHFANFDLAPEHDERLQQWIAEHLTLATWTKPADEAYQNGQFLLRIERALLARWTPPLNDKDNPGRWTELRSIRKAMADDARIYCSQR